jgi:hypothetical protein
MALRFVSTSIQETDDSGNVKEIAIDSVEARAAKAAAAQAEIKPLYLQLADKANRKQEEYDKIGKLMHAPPKALDEEDVAFYDGLEFTKKNALQARRDRDETALQAFRTAQNAVVFDAPNSVSVTLNPSERIAPATKSAASMLQVAANTTIIKTIIKAKRKNEQGSSSEGNGNNDHLKIVVDDINSAKKQKSECNGTSSSPSNTLSSLAAIASVSSSSSTALTSLFSAYESDNDE